MHNTLTLFYIFKQEGTKMYTCTCTFMYIDEFRISWIRMVLAVYICRPLISISGFLISLGIAVGKS